MNEPKHTPGPWEVSGTSIITCDGQFCIAVIEDDGGYEAPHEQQEANAAYIVQACNERPAMQARIAELEARNKALVEALEKQLKVRHDHRQFRLDHGDPEYQEWLVESREANKLALAALANAQPEGAK